ncbi:MAG: 50S ribosomal protein L35 [Alphaproteobacteria bacterium]|nr:50S ribosomal protein L35 [Alphaproteobacteria bacterium]MCH9853772.1 50S ribosomal protein L35 [Alphaproteobacteria bacterium]
MPKLKTKSSFKKRFKVTATGKIKFFSACLRHNTGNRTQKMKRTNRGSQVMKACDARFVKRYFAGKVR